MSDTAITSVFRVGLSGSSHDRPTVCNGRKPSPLWRKVNGLLPDGVSPGLVVRRLLAEGYTWPSVGEIIRDEFNLEQAPVNSTLDFWARVEPMWSDDISGDAPRPSATRCVSTAN